MTTPLHELLERLEKAEGPDREIDALIVVCFRVTDNLAPWVDKNFPVWRARSDGHVEVVHNAGEGGVNWKPESYTASLDAVIALVEKMGWSVHFLHFSPKRQNAAICKFNRSDHGYEAEAKTMPIATLTAMVKALIAEKENE